MGNATVASGINSFATGATSIASGLNSVAVGTSANASAEGAVALGTFSNASAYGSFAVSGGNASADYAIGLGGQAYGINSVAFTGGQANNLQSVAIGLGAVASADYSYAFGGNVNTMAQTGSFIMGDASSTSTYNDANNQMMMRFAGGYKFYSDASSTVGAQMAPGGNSWSTISDVRKKENFAPVNGEEVLRKFAGFQLTSWNYKGQDAKTHRHYGPMAQDFYAAFGKDAYGTVGNDTTINQADMEGVSFVAIQALVKKTQALEQENALLKGMLAKQNGEYAELKAKTEKVADLTARLEAVEASINANKGISIK